MHGLCTLAPLYQSVEKFEVPSFTNYKDMIESKIFKNGSRDSDHAPFVTIGWLGFETFLHNVTILTSSSDIPDIHWGR